MRMDQSHGDEHEANELLSDEHLPSVEVSDEKVSSESSGLKARIFILVAIVFCALLIGWVANDLLSGRIDLFSGKPAVVSGQDQSPTDEDVFLTKEKLDGSLKDAVLAHKNCEEAKVKILAKINEFKRIYNVLRFRKNVPADSEECLRYVRLAKDQEKVLEDINSQIKKLASAELILQVALDDLAINGSIPNQPEISSLLEVVGKIAAINKVDQDTERQSEFYDGKFVEKIDQNPDEYMSVDE